MISLKNTNFSKSLVSCYINKLIENKIYPIYNVYFRGQSDINFGNVTSNAFRTLTFGSSKTRISQNRFIAFNKELVEKAKLNGYGIKNGRQLNDLELLAEIQHFGGATCLIDFTSNFLTALWFASRVKFENGKAVEKDGKIFIIKQSKESKKFSKISHKDINQSIEELLLFKSGNAILTKDIYEIKDTEPEYWIWEPEPLNNRILQQDSVFIFGKPIIQEQDCVEIIVKKEDKSYLDSELRAFYNIHGETLFKDIQGFATQINATGLGWYKLINETDDLAEKHFKIAENHSESGDYLNAIDELTKAIDINDADDNYYFARGNAYFNLGRFKDSISNYNKAVEIDPDIARVYDVYGNIGLANFNLGFPREAKASFEKSLEIEPRNIDSLLGLANLYILAEDYPNALVELEKALKIRPKHSQSYFIRAYVKGHKEDIKGMEEDYISALLNDFNNILPNNINKVEASIIAGDKTFYKQIIDNFDNYENNVEVVLLKYLKSIGDNIFDSLEIDIEGLEIEITQMLESIKVKIEWSSILLNSWIIFTDKIDKKKKDLIQRLIVSFDKIINEHNAYF